jgi:hypothetical protein
MEHKLQAREYKILLDPEKSSKLVTLKSVNAFWKRHIQPVIVDTLDTSAEKCKDFEQLLERDVRFYDTVGCILTRNQYSLRDRTGPDGKAGERERKISIKLRSPDLFVVASTELAGKGNGDPDFEEDIAPLEATGPKGRVTLESPPSMRSRFSLVVEEEVDGRKKLQTWADVVRLFPALPALIPAGQVPAAGARLRKGKAIRELAFKGAECELDDGAEAEFTLTLWFFGRDLETVRIAEISYKCEFKNGFMPRLPALRAFELFVGLQKKLAGRIDLGEASKTKLALPEACARL